MPPSIVNYFFPDLVDLQSALELPGFSHVGRLITGHCSLMAYLHHFGLADSSRCNCVHPAESVEHYIFECELFSSERAKLKVECSLIGEWPPTIDALGRHPGLWAVFVDFVAKSGRLNSRQRQGRRNTPAF